MAVRVVGADRLDGHFVAPAADEGVDESETELGGDDWPSSLRVPTRVAGLPR
jgi:hypothetical protein